MNVKELEQFFNYLKESRLIFGPKESIKREGRSEVLIDNIDDFGDLILDNRLPVYSFKRFFVPECETLFGYKNGELSEKNVLLQKSEKKVIFGINLLDLKSILLYDQVFEKDPYYQVRRQNILVIGHSFLPDLPQNIFEETFEEDVLEHLSFDIFLAAPKEKGEWSVFSGSSAGQKILKDFGYHDYIHIQFSGPVKEGKLDKKMLGLKDKLENYHNQKIWDELGLRCIECGKCTIVCPTCFCFRIDDQVELGESQGFRQRCWDACFYQEFSEVAGPLQVQDKLLNFLIQPPSGSIFGIFINLPEFQKNSILWVALAAIVARKYARLELILRKC